MNQRLLILRPQPGADQTADRARNVGFLPIVCPLFEVKPVSWTAPDPTHFDAVMLTSANAPRHAGDALKVYTRLPAMCVGEATADAARLAGFARVDVAGPDSSALLQAIDVAGYNRALHLCGVHVRPLPDTKLSITRLPVYESAETDPSALLETVQPDDIALLHSPRAAAVLDRIVPEHLRVHIAHVAISRATLQAAGDGWAAALAAPTPDDGAMLALARQMCQGLPSDNSREPEP